MLKRKLGKWKKYDFAGIAKAENLGKLQGILCEGLAISKKEQQISQSYQALRGSENVKNFCTQTFQATSVEQSNQKMHPESKRNFDKRLLSMQKPCSILGITQTISSQIIKRAGNVASTCGKTCNTVSCLSVMRLVTAFKKCFASQMSLECNFFSLKTHDHITQNHHLVNED